MDSRMRLEGTLKNWNDDRGFGFIEPAQGGQELFAHIKAFPSSYGRPAVGAKVTFDVETTADGKKRAIRIQPVSFSNSQVKRPGPRQRPWDKASLVALCVFAVSYLVITLVWDLSIYVGLVYLAMSLITVVFYWADKRSAQAGEWRISESALIMLGGFGGWPGAMFAQHVFQHKTTKPSFRFEHWGSVITNMTLFYLAATPLWRLILRAIFQ
jgi:uncharacterized membrane protein YsdA (DUF1294 family)/cold shock CspA family protein